MVGCIEAASHRCQVQRPRRSRRSDESLAVRQRALSYPVDKTSASVYIIRMECHLRSPKETGLVHYRDFGRIGVKPTKPGPAALVRSLEPQMRCSLTALCVDVPSTVRAAGGWLFDRARAGWRVTALAPIGSDLAPLRILGAETIFFPPGLDPSTFQARLEPSLFTPMPASLAVAAELLGSSAALNTRVQALARRGMEVVVWGEDGFQSDETFDQARHRLSAAASAFKDRALRAASSVGPQDSTEFLRTRGSWYALEHDVDLERVRSIPHAPTLDR